MTCKSRTKNLIDADCPLTMAAARMGHENLDALAITTRPQPEGFGPGGD